MHPALPYRRHRGFTLTELAIVLGVIGLVLGGIWTAMSGVSNARKVNQAQQQITTIASNVRSLYSTRGSFSAANLAATDITPALITANAMPTDLQLTSTYGINSWGGNVQVYAMTPQQFRICYSWVPSNVCLELAQQLSSNGGTKSGGATQLLVNATYAVDLTSTASTSAVISAACANLGNGGNGTKMELDFPLH